MSDRQTGPDTRTRNRVAAAVAAVKDSAGGYALRLEPTVVGRLWSRLLEVEFVDRSVALAAKLLVSLFPLLIVVAALSPEQARPTIVGALVARFGLSGASLDLLRAAFATPEETRNATGVVGLVVVIAFAVSFTTALQRVYLRAWRRPAGGGIANKRRGAVWVGGVVVMILLIGVVRSLVAGPAGSFTAWLSGVTLAVLLWWWTARLMLRGEVRWRPLLPTAVITGLGSWLYTLVAAVWFPSTVAKNFAQFGAFGIGLSFVTFFTGLAFVVVAGAVAAPALADGDDALGRWLRHGEPPLVAGAAPALPGPSRPLRLSDAFGRGSGGSGVSSP